MIRLRVTDILEERGLSKYWLYKRLDMSYQNYSKMLDNKTQGIRYDTIDRLCKILACPVGELFEYTDKSQEEGDD